MEYPERLVWSINVLTTAFLNDTLIAGNCKACAVGNLITAAIPTARPLFQTLFVTQSREQDNNKYEQVKVKGDSDIISHSLFEASFRIREKKLASPAMQRARKEAVKQIEALPYTLDEVAKIENTFEIAVDYEDIDIEAGEIENVERLFTRLQAVLKLLFSFEGLDYDEDIELAFKAKPELAAVLKKI